jgi:hypothetical protein
MTSTWDRDNFIKVWYHKKKPLEKRLEKKCWMMILKKKIRQKKCQSQLSKPMTRVIDWKHHTWKNHEAQSLEIKRWRMKLYKKSKIKK